MYIDILHSLNHIKMQYCKLLSVRGFFFIFSLVIVLYFFQFYLIFQIFFILGVFFFFLVMRCRNRMRNEISRKHLENPIAHFVLFRVMHGLQYKNCDTRVYVFEYDSVCVLYFLMLRLINIHTVFPLTSNHSSRLFVDYNNV